MIVHVIGDWSRAPDWTGLFSFLFYLRTVLANPLLSPVRPFLLLSMHDACLHTEEPHYYCSCARCGRKHKVARFIGWAAVTLLSPRIIVNFISILYLAIDKNCVSYTPEHIVINSSTACSAKSVVGTVLYCCSSRFHQRWKRACMYVCAVLNKHDRNSLLAAHRYIHPYLLGTRSSKTWWSSFFMLCTQNNNVARTTPPPTAPPPAQISQ